ncbi:hypothetical protein Vadar_022401 [Vaccinium darrowii]|uniref:Uncharacterized protein n=1 Tax=Vaccinium darrowii TaxID=229202 RepID=A0ACB7XTH7_9ERIC|nr:hypothetical protein Vadar_022401 [Vaccinium darrowii]
MPATVLVPAAQAILNVLIPLVTQQINLAWGFEGDLKKLKRRLKNIQALLRDAEKGKIESEALKEWLKSLKSATCDAENVLGELEYEALRRKLDRKRDQVSHLFDKLEGSISHPAVLFCGPPVTMEEQWVWHHVK